MGKTKTFCFIIICLLSACSKNKLIVDTTEMDSGTGDRLNKVKFFNNQIGFAVGGQQFSKPTLLKTLNGGETWNEVALPTNYQQKEIYGFDILPNGKIITVGYGGTIFLSVDTGITFQYVQHNSWKELKDIAFRDSLLAYIVGGVGFNSGHISEFKTDGSGNNQLKEEKGFEICDIDFIDSNIAYLSGYGAIMKSTDGGSSWNFTEAKNDFFKAMCWKNSQQGIAVGYEGSIIKTSDGGQNWHVIRNGNNITKKKVHFLDVEQNGAGKVIAVGEHGVVFVSSDDGETWVETNNFSYTDLRGIFFRDAQTCFIVGDNGKIYKLSL